MVSRPQYDQGEQRKPSKLPDGEARDPKKLPWYQETEIDTNDEDYSQLREGTEGHKNSKRRQTSWKAWTARATSWRSTSRMSNGSIKHWKPLTLRAPVLGPFIFVSLSLIALLEFLAYRSRRRRGTDPGGGLAFASTVNDLSAVTLFTFQYLPTIIAVFYSMIWGWVDLDAKRLEPWFQLSKPEGASAEDSLLLQYQFDFLAVVPWKAAKKKHWSVLFSGLTMMLVFWVITPFQSAIFTTGQVQRIGQTQMGTTSAIISLSDQVSMLSTNFLNTAYGVSWLSQKLPAYTTRAQAVIPFEPVTERKGTLPTETWTTEGYTFTTNLSCSPALTIPNDDFTFTFDNQRGCTYPEVELPDAKSINASYLILYIGYYPDSLGTQTGYWLQSRENNTCGAEFSNNFLAIWGSAKSQDGNGTYHNLTAAFCEPSYQVQRASIRVNASDRSVLSLQPLSSSPLAEGMLNITNFEYIIGTGAPTSQFSRDYSNATVPMQYPRLLDDSLASPITNMVGYALAALKPNETVEQLRDPAKLHSVFEEAHQLLFSMAATTIIRPFGQGTRVDIRDGVLQDSPSAIVFVRPFSIAVEAALGLVSALAAAIWYVSNRRRSMLIADPASLTKVIKLVQGSREILDEFKDDGTTTAEILQKRITNRWFRLRILETRDGVVEKLEALSARSLESQSFWKDKKSAIFEDGYQHFKPIRPLELQWKVGFGLVAILALAIAILTALFWEATSFDGIIRPTNNQLVLTVLENLIPTAFASLLEPFWVVLNRLLCLLQPFEDLRIGRATATSSIDAKYTSLPPQFAIWRAFKARHFLLAAVCITATSSNLLAVALSGLFFEGEIIVSTPINTEEQIGTVFNGTPSAYVGNPATPVYYYDPFYVAISNLTQNTSLPAWTDKDRFYIPFNLSEDLPFASQAAAFYTGNTRAFGANISCKTPGSSGSNTAIDFSITNNYTGVSVMVDYTLSNGSVVHCTTGLQENGFQNFTRVDAPSDAASALEIASMMSPASPSDGLYGGICGTVLLLGWVRLTPLSPKGSRSLSSKFLTCIPTLSTALFNVSLSPSGHILQSRQTTPFETDLSPYFVGNESITLFSQSNNLIAPSSKNMEWHNDSHTLDWPNSLLSIALSSSSLVDPADPLPSSTVITSTVAPSMEYLYRLLFATTLALNMDIFSSVSPSSPKPNATIAIPQTRIFMSRPMFGIAMSLLLLNLVVAIAYYVKRPKKFLPRMPTSIGSLIAYVSASNALEPVARPVRNDSGEGKNMQGKEGETRYAYGYFIGLDGRGHVGVDMQEHVVPLKRRKDFGPDGKGMGRRWGTWKNEQEKELSRVGNWI